MKIHVCLVSDQVLPNLIPALMERPDKIVLVTTAEMKRREQDVRQQEILAAHGLSVEIFEKNAPDVRWAAIRGHADALLATDVLQGAEVILNATGGTKLMMLGFVEAFRAAGKRVIYTDTAHRRIEEIGGAEIPMADVLDVPGYMAAQGMRFSHADSDDEQKRDVLERRAMLTRFIGRNSPKLAVPIMKLNEIMANAVKRDKKTRTDTLACPQFKIEKVPDYSLALFHELLKQANELGLLKVDIEKKEGRIADLDSARYFNGGWLEEYAWLCLRDARLFDARMGVHRVGETDEINEFDALAVHFNQLLFIECKTANYLYKIGEANQVAYKVDSLGRLARGLFGATWLLSAIKPPQELIDRARDARFRLVGPGELPKLRELVQAWMQDGA